MNALFDSFGLSLEQISGLATSLLAVLLTLATMSRLLRENLFSRLAQLLFVGVAAGYAVGLAWWHILWPRLVIVMADPLGQWPLTLAMALGLLLLARGFRPASTLGDAPVSILLGVGVGLALVGAVRGTLVPQVLVAMWGATTPTNSPRWIGIASPIILTLVTVAALAAFHHQRRERGLPGAIDRVLQALGAVGRRLVIVALGAVLAGAWVTFFAALQGRVALVQRFISEIVALWSQTP